MTACSSESAFRPNMLVIPLERHVFQVTSCELETSARRGNLDKGEGVILLSSQNLNENPLNKVSFNKLKQTYLWLSSLWKQLASSSHIVPSGRKKPFPQFLWKFLWASHPAPWRKMGRCTPSLSGLCDLTCLQIAASSLAHTSLHSSCQPCWSLPSSSQHATLPGSSLLSHCAIGNSFSVLSFSFLCLSFPPRTHAALQSLSHAQHHYRDRSGVWCWSNLLYWVARTFWNK